jgi:hypothetical protein
MAWFFEGTGQQLGLSLSRNGSWSAYGTCSQSCHPSAGDLNILGYLKGGVQGSWSIHSPDAEEHEYDGVGRGLKGFFHNNEGKAAAIIHYHNSDAQNPALVGASILMPQPAFNETIALFKTVIGNSKITYGIALEFLGFRNPEVEPSDLLPSVREFVDPNLFDARPYFSREVTIYVHSFGISSATSERSR